MKADSFTVGLRFFRSIHAGPKVNISYERRKISEYLLRYLIICLLTTAVCTGNTVFCEAILPLIIAQLFQPSRLPIKATRVSNKLHVHTSSNFLLLVEMFPRWCQLSHVNKTAKFTLDQSQNWDTVEILSNDMLPLGLKDAS